MSKKQMPPVPPENVSDQGPGDPHLPKAESHRIVEENRNTAEQGRQGNIHQNTHNQGYQQDR